MSALTEKYDEAHVLLDCLFRAGGYIDLRAKTDRKDANGQPVWDNLLVKADRGAPEKVEAFAEEHDGRDVYFGVAARDGQGRDAEHLDYTRVLWAEIDFHATTDREWLEAYDRTLEKIEALGAMPTFIVRSGGGVHLYWLLHSLVEVDTDQARADLKTFLRALALAVGGDLQSAEPVRILRLPGTLNHKYDPPRPVTMPWANLGRNDAGERAPVAYTLDQIGSCLDRVHGPLWWSVVDGPKAAKERAHVPETSIPKLTPEERIARARKFLAREPGGYTQGFRPDDPVQCGDAEATRVSMSMRGFDLDEEQAFEAMRDWNARCSPPWPERELRAKIGTSLRNAKEQRGARLVEPRVTSVDFGVMSDVVEREHEWLWHARLLRGAVTMFEGPPEVGKTATICDLAAAESRGRPFPGEKKEDRAPGVVVMLVAEDDVEATIVPRLRAAGADLKRIHYLKATRDEEGQPVPFHLSDDGARLQEKAKAAGATLITVDPLVAYIGSRRGRAADTNNDFQTRKALLPLKELAEETRASVLAVRHHRKGSNTKAAEAGGGSVAFTALTRVQLHALPDPSTDDKDSYLLAVGKNNLVPKSERPAVSYRLVPWEEKRTVVRVAWGPKVEKSADEVLCALAEKEQRTHGRGGAKDAARAFLVSYLGAGEKPADDVIEAAEENGHTEKTLRAAKKDLHVESIQTRDGWSWRLPAAGCEPAHPGQEWKPREPGEEG